MAMISDLCPSCLHDSFESLVDFGVIPASGTFLGYPEQPHRRACLHFEFCSRCGLVRRKAFMDETYDYAHASRTTAHRLPSYAGKIAEALGLRGVHEANLVIDVGANDGAFLDVLAGAGFTKRLGIEPSGACAALYHSKGHAVERTYLDLGEAERIRQQYGPAGAVTCRHTLEHVKDPLGCLSAMRSLLDNGGILFVEVPDIRGVTRNLRGHELWDEHLYGFTEETLRLLVIRAGFRVDKSTITSHGGETVILLWCTAGPATTEQLSCPSAISSDVEFCRCFKSRWSSFCERVLKAQLDWPRPIVCLGASHPQSNFLHFTGLGRYVSGLVDDDLAKVGKWVPIPQPVPVLSSEQLLDGQMVGSMVFSAFGHEEWMYRRFGLLSEKGVRIIVPYDLDHEGQEKRSVV